MRSRLLEEGCCVDVCGLACRTNIKVVLKPATERTDPAETSKFQERKWYKPNVRPNVSVECLVHTTFCVGYT